jgi:hypothetical protein
MKTTALSSALAFALSSLGLVPALDAYAGGTQASGNYRFVTSCADDGRAGTLRSEVSKAATGGTVDLGALVCNTITLTKGAIAVPLNDLTLRGPIWHSLTISGNQRGRVFDHTGLGTLSIATLTVADGLDEEAAAAGGCIRSTGNVSLVWSMVRDCVATGTDPNQIAKGGGIYAAGEVTLDASVVSGNVVQSFAPGAYVYVYGGGLYAHALTANYSSITGNTAHVPPLNKHGRGGGAKVDNHIAIFASTIDTNTSDGAGAGLNMSGDGDSPSTTIVNSTISGNVSSSDYGAAWLGPGDLEVSNSTVAFNHTGSAGAYGGIYSYSDNSTLQSSIIANNDGTDFAEGYYATVTGANNLITNSTVALPPDTIVADPMLAPLRNNGGFTQTNALLPGSPAIDAGNNTAHLVWDQRGQGYVRKVGASVDIGAIEYHGHH